MLAPGGAPQAGRVPGPILVHRTSGIHDVFDSGVAKVLENKGFSHFGMEKYFKQSIWCHFPNAIFIFWHLENGNRIWKNAPNALFEVLSNFKMRKVFVFKCFWDVGIGKCMNCRRAAAENATRVRGMGLALVRCKEQPRLTIACPRRRSACRQGAGSHPRPPHLGNS